MPQRYVFCLAARLSLLTPLPFLMPVLSAQAQQTARVLITGTVRDASGAPLEQVSLGVEGQPGGTNTDDKGRFALNVVRPLTGKQPTLVARR